jgi:hypothetical protein
MGAVRLIGLSQSKHKAIFLNSARNVLARTDRLPIVRIYQRFDWPLEVMQKFAYCTHDGKANDNEEDCHGDKAVEWHKPGQCHHAR